MSLLEHAVTNFMTFEDRSKESFILSFQMKSTPFPIIKQFHNLYLF